MSKITGYPGNFRQLIIQHEAEVIILDKKRVHWCEDPHAKYANDPSWSERSGYWKDGRTGELLNIIPPQSAAKRYPPQKMIILPHQTPEEIALVKEVLIQLGHGKLAGMKMLRAPFNAIEFDDGLPEKPYLTKVYAGFEGQDENLKIRRAEVMKGDKGDVCYISVDANHLAARQHILAQAMNMR